MTNSCCVCVRKRPQSARKRPRVSRTFRSCKKGFLVAKRTVVVNFGLCVSKVSTVTGMGASWSRNAQLPSPLDVRLVLVSQKCQQSQGSETVPVAKRRTVVTSWTCGWSSRLKSVNSQGDPRGSGGSSSQNAALSSLLDLCFVFAFQ